MAAPEKNAGERQEKMNQTAQQTQRSASEVTIKAAADVSARAARIGIELVKRNNETAKQLWSTLTHLMTRLTQQSGDQFGRMISGDDAADVLEKSSRHLDALFEFTKVMAAASQDFSRQWTDTVRKDLEAGISRSANLARCRTPQELFGAEAELARESFNTILEGTRRASEISARAAQEANSKMSDRIREAA